MSSVKELRALRTNAGISQNALAKAIGRSHTYVWNVEAGRVKLTARETIEVWAESNTDRGMTRASVRDRTARPIAVRGVRSMSPVPVAMTVPRSGS